MNIDKAFFPGFTRKSITFTIDDGNVPLDKIFLGIVRAAGIIGTFNLCSHSANQISPSEYVQLYKGYEIANHCKYHPFAMTDGVEYELSDDIFDENTADENKIYKTDIEDIYYFKAPNGWRKIADTAAYCRFIDECKEELEQIFGKDTVKGFAWPFSMQTNSQVFEHLKKSGYSNVRKTGEVLDKTGFALPEDRMRWSFNVTYRTLLQFAEIYDKYPDDGKLKFFCLGGHSHDYRNNNCWDVLEKFAELYGNRPNDFWYASVIDIFEYEDAVNAMIVTDQYVENNSDISVYIKIDGEKAIIQPHSRYSLKTI